MEDPLLDDLAAEHDELDALLGALDDRAWDAPTPAAGFAVRDQVFHLAFSEELAALALTDEDSFGARLQQLLGDLDGLEADSHRRARLSEPEELLACWRVHRQRTLDALRRLASDSRVPWITGPMSRASFATARLMETWAHGQDVYDGLGREREPTERLRHVADLGVRTRAFAYRNRGMEPPASEMRGRARSTVGRAVDLGRRRRARHRPRHRARLLPRRHPTPRSRRDRARRRRADGRGVAGDRPGLRRAADGAPMTASFREELRAWLDAQRDETRARARRDLDHGGAA